MPDEDRARQCHGPGLRRRTTDPTARENRYEDHPGRSMSNGAELRCRADGSRGSPDIFSASLSPFDRFEVTRPNQVEEIRTRRQRISPGATATGSGPLPGRVDDSSVVEACRAVRIASEIGMTTPHVVLPSTVTRPRHAWRHMTSSRVAVAPPSGPLALPGRHSCVLEDQSKYSI